MRNVSEGGVGWQYGWVSGVGRLCVEEGGPGWGCVACVDVRECVMCVRTVG